MLEPGSGDGNRTDRMSAGGPLPTCPRVDYDLCSLKYRHHEILTESLKGPPSHQHVNCFPLEHWLWRIALPPSLAVHYLIGFVIYVIDTLTGVWFDSGYKTFVQKMYHNQGLLDIQKIHGWRWRPSPRPSRRPPSVSASHTRWCTHWWNCWHDRVPDSMHDLRCWFSSAPRWNAQALWGRDLQVWALRWVLGWEGVLLRQ